MMTQAYSFCDRMFSLIIAYRAVQHCIEMPSDLLIICKLNSSDYGVRMMFSTKHLSLSQVMSAIDQSNVGKSLWIVTKSHLTGCVNLLREQPKLTGIAQ